MQLQQKTLFLGLTVVFFACNDADKSAGGHPSKHTGADSLTNNTSPNTAKTSQPIIGKDSVTIPPFEVHLVLSNKAKDRIVSTHETIIFRVVVGGTPKKKARVHLEEDGSFFLASSEHEVQYGQPVRFENIKFARKLYDQLADKDFEVTVNIYSGRKSSPDNLIDCDFVFGKISEVANKQFTVKGKLIYGDD